MDKTPSSFTPPRHWIGPEELEASYWNNPEVREKRAQEFYEKPVELIDMIDRNDTAGLARRDFLTIMGASMAMASFACARRPVHKIIPYVVKPEEVTPGVANWYASTSRDGYGVLVKNREGRPIKLEGNPDHPVNRGKLDARGQASLLNLYDPDRIKAPVSRARAGGARKEITWKDVDAAIAPKLKAASKVRILTGEIRGESTQRVIREFLAGYPNAAHVVYEPLCLEEIAEAQAHSYGTAVVPHYRFDQAHLIVSLGADFLGAWENSVEYAGQWATLRKLDSGNAAGAKMSKLVCFESTMTVTGANADERIPVRPGDEYKIALAIAHELIVTQRHSALAGDAAVAAALSGYTPEAVAVELALDGGVNRIKRLAQDLWANRGKSLVVAGGIHAHTGDRIALQVAVNLLNSALENEGATVDGTARSMTEKSRFADVFRLIKEMGAGQVEVLIIQGSNPVYSLGRLGAMFADAAAKVPLVIAMKEIEDETSALADYELPEPHFLENWGDAMPRKGVMSLQQPALAPIHSSRAMEDSLIAWSKATGKATGLIAASADWHAYLQANWKQTVYQQNRIAGTFEQFWEGVLRQGVFDAYAAQGVLAPKPAVRSFRSASLSVVPKYAKSASPKIMLALYQNCNMHDGRDANNAWLQELPDPISSVTWDNYLNVAPKLAKELGLAENDVVEVTAGDVKAELPVHVQPGMHPNVVSAAVGYGRKVAGRVGTGCGVDVFPFVTSQKGILAYSGHEVKLRKTGRVYRLANTQWHTATENRPVINDITLAEFRKNPATENHTDPHLRMATVPTMWPAHEYKGYRWGMAIDLNSCTGCGACMIGCQAENNVPVVGRDQVRNSRQMHWLRIDRYYSGTPENPEVVFQPMLCQHCENASCETVCPVLATMHDDEGLNVQVYNRCVGTRYCQNNCPYKVRRFNFFDHWKSYEGTMNLVWNPDVTVRTRGIMEKCTFCLQRIRDAKDKAKDSGMRVQDGSFQTACQQTCPTDAIVFGDINDPNSRVSKLRSDTRAFRVLEILNNKPVISYMTKVRNVERAAGHGHAAPGAGEAKH